MTDEEMIAAVERSLHSARPDDWVKLAPQTVEWLLDRANEAIAARKKLAEPPPATRCHCKQPFTYSDWLE